ncbi:Rho guanine nucleotide exchange factor 5 [Labeo rohita]|uniref:Rho guanine nucleotide exchange factor 5 n=1 Tax=Labeo rohita TaxID=84645 RepID=A0ABQ8MDY4_LABRO|nr:Rho guanine nucleotide exchange factor 5 [Labeo rohita]
MSIFKYFKKREQNLPTEEGESVKEQKRQCLDGQSESGITGQVLPIGAAKETTSVEGGTAGMFCRVCRQHRPPLKNGPKMRPFVEVGAVHYRKDYIERHINTEHHQHSIKCHKSFESGNSVMNAFDPCLYWLVKNEIAHHTNYGKLLSLAQLLGCDYFHKLKVDRRNNYCSHRIIDEMLEIISKVIEEPIFNCPKWAKMLFLLSDSQNMFKKYVCMCY